jgi:hypothetical protein
MCRGPVGFAETYSRRTFSFSPKLFLPKFLPSFMICLILLFSQDLPALNLINPPTIVISTSSSLIYGRIYLSNLWRAPFLHILQEVRH